MHGVRTIKTKTGTKKSASIKKIILRFSILYNSDDKCNIDGSNKINRQRNYCRIILSDPLEINNISITIDQKRATAHNWTQKV
ncbi:MAG TPA: hypothetical protein VMV49_12545 [Candidatus Deferrimicrobium sp.]|nr:hypothetical protein [Candidatus Deferrimicrobium sp.]